MFCVAGLIKKCEPKADDNGFQRPTFAQLNRTLGVQSNGDVTNGEPNVKEVDNSFGEPSPLVPIRLSQRFHNAVASCLWSLMTRGFVCPGRTGKMFTRPV